MFGGPVGFALDGLGGFAGGFGLLGGGWEVGGEFGEAGGSRESGVGGDGLLAPGADAFEVLHGGAERGGLEHLGQIGQRAGVDVAQVQRRVFRREEVADEGVGEFEFGRGRVVLILGLVMVHGRRVPRPFGGTRAAWGMT